MVFGLGLRAVVRLLVHQLPRRAARHGRQEHDRRPPHAADRRRAQDALPRPGDPARHDRRGPGLDRPRTATACRPRSSTRAIYAKAIAAGQEAAGQASGRRRPPFKAVTDAIGKKLNQAKVAALVKDRAASSMTKQLKERLPERGRRERLRRRHPLAGEEVLPDRPAGPGADRRCWPRSCPAWRATSPPSTRSGPTTFTRPTSPRTRATSTTSGWAGAITVVGILLSIVCAYFVSRWYNNAMDIIQLVFGFVNAPLFATFLLGMFWKRTTGTGAFLGLLGGTGTSALFHALTIAAGNTPGRQGRLPRPWSRSSPATWPRTSGWPASPSPSASC